MMCNFEGICYSKLTIKYEMVYQLIAVTRELIGTLALKESEGFTKVFPLLK